MFAPTNQYPLPTPPPPAAVPAPPSPSTAAGVPRKVVYLPSCVTRMMGPSGSDSETASVHEKLMSLFGKGGYEVIVPKGVDSLCCGMMFNR